MNQRPQTFRDASANRPLQRTEVRAPVQPKRTSEGSDQLSVIGESRELQTLLDVILQQLSSATYADWGLLLLRSQFSDHLELARNKRSLRHPAARTHAAIQAVCLGLALGGQAGLVLGFIHLLIDTRLPVAGWIRRFKKCGQAPEAGSIAIWLDQTLHIVCIAVWVALVRN